MKLYYIIAALIIVVIVLFFIFQWPTGSQDETIGDNIKFFMFTRNGNSTGKASVSVPFINNLPATSFMDIFVDLNNDSEYDETELIINNMPVRARKNWRNNFYFEAPETLQSAKKIKVVLGSEEKEGNVTIIPFESGNLLDLVNVTNPEESMKGLGNIIVSADNGVEVDVSIDNVPDISQDPGECAPTAAANSLIHLVNKNNGGNGLPSDTSDFIDQLRDEMDWTKENGVLPDNFVTGKNKWAQDNDLPIHTEKVGDKHGETTLEDIQEAVENGDGVELRLTYGNPNTGEAVGGHMVTVTGIHIGYGQTYIDINDPGSPEGTDTVEIQGNQITNYGPFEGWTLLSWGFIQTWEGGAVSTGDDSDEQQPPDDAEDPDGTTNGEDTSSSKYSYEDLAKMTPEEIRALGSVNIDALSYGGKLFPFPEEQFIACNNCPGCDELHYHATTAFSLDLQSVSEPADPCRWGNSISTITATPDQIIDWFHNKT